MVEIKDRIGLSFEDAAELVSVSAPTLRQWARRPDADFAVKIGGRSIISRVKLEAWLARQAENAC